MIGFAFSLVGDEGRQADAVVAHDGRAAGAPAVGAGPAAEAGAARARARRWLRPDRVDVRSAAGRSTRTSTSRSWAWSATNTRRTSTAIEQRAASRHADRSLRRAVAAARAARRAPHRRRTRSACRCDRRTRRRRRWRIRPQSAATVAGTGVERPVARDAAACGWRFRPGSPRCSSKRPISRSSGACTRERSSRPTFARGYRAVDFELQRERGGGRYLLARQRLRLDGRAERPAATGSTS